MSEKHWQEARLIPTSGIRGSGEQERRATSALLAVLMAVREFQRSILRPLGAPAGRVTTFCEVPFKLADGRDVRVDGLVQVVRGKRTWRLLVEVKTGKSELGREQVENYLDVVRQEKLDGLLTISNQLVSVYGQHPVGSKQRRHRRLLLHHLSWTRIRATARRVNEHIGVEDPDQKWILQELIRYLDHEGSGARSFDDMGPFWNPLRSALRQQTLQSGDEAARGMATSWEHLLQHMSLSLAARLGTDVRPVLSRHETGDPALRTEALSRELATHGTLSGAIGVPDAIAPVTVSANLHSMDVTVSVDVRAPRAGRPATRLNWLLRQLGNAPDTLSVTTSFERTQLKASRSLAVLRESPKAALTETDRPPRTFTVALTRRVGSKRRAGSGSFVHDTEKLVDEFYREVVQGLKAWTPPAPKLAQYKHEQAEEHSASAMTGAP